jgi:aspartate aminotransferase
MTVIQSNSTSGPSSISQSAAIAALIGPQNLLAEQADSFRVRRDFVVKAFNEIQGLSCRRPDGAFYAYVNCSNLLGATTLSGDVIKTDSDFCRYILNSANVAVVPGSAFGLAPFFRVSYAASLSDLEAAIGRIRKAVQMLRD